MVSVGFLRSWGYARSKLQVVPFEVCKAFPQNSEDLANFMNSRAYKRASSQIKKVCKVLRDEMVGKNSACDNQVWSSNANEERRTTGHIPQRFSLGKNQVLTSADRLNTN